MATQDQKSASDLGEQAIALAEQLGRIAGTIEGTAESWLNRQKLADQLTRVRDGATQMLEGLTAGAERGRKAATTAVRKSLRRRLHLQLRHARPIHHARPASGAESRLRRCEASRSRTSGFRR